MILKKRYLNLGDMTYTANLTEPPQMSPVLSYTVPLKMVTYVDPTLPVMGLFYARYDKELEAGEISGDDSNIVTISLPYRVSISETRYMPVYMIHDPTGTPSVVSATILDESTTRRTVRGTFGSSVDVGDTVRVLFPIDNARLELDVVSPAGSSETIVKLLNTSTGVLNTVRFTDKRQLEKLIVKRIVPALEDFQIQVRVDASVPIVFNDPAFPEFNHPFIELPIVESDIYTLTKIRGRFRNYLEFQEYLNRMIRLMK